MKISVAHSPDADDHFLFWAIRDGLINTSGFDFSFTAQHTQALNEAALKKSHDVVAVSTGVLPFITAHYAVLTSGASVGRGYGPVLIAQSGVMLAELERASIAIPGRHTTAAAITRLLLPDAQFVEIPIEPFSAVYTALEEGKVDAAVIIHEGQFSYQSRGFALVRDLGEYWFERTSLPLVVGVNVIGRHLGAKIAQLSEIFEESIRYALKYQAAAIPALVEGNLARACDTADDAGVTHYLSKYANIDSVRLTEDSRESIRTFCSLVGNSDNIDFV